MLFGIYLDNGFHPKAMLTQCLHSHLVSRGNLSHIERNVKLDHNIREKLYLVCIINDVVNYSVGSTVLVSLNLNEYRMPIVVPYWLVRVAQR